MCRPGAQRDDIHLESVTRKCIHQISQSFEFYNSPSSKLFVERYPLLNEYIIQKVKKLLNGKLIETLNMIETLIEIEHSYINTNFEEFKEYKDDLFSKSVIILRKTIFQT